MKKVLFLALAAAAVMSCSESEEIENAGQKAEIKLGTVVGNTTRATVTDLPELQKVGFTVYAYNTGATTMASVATFDAMKEFMAAVKVTYSAPDWSLTGGTYYWPMTDNLQFFAYGNPGTGALTYNQPAAGAIYPSITYTVADVANGLGSRESDGCNQGIKCQWGIFEIRPYTDPNKFHCQGSRRFDL